MNPSQLVDELSTRIRLAGHTPTIPLLIGRDAHAIAESREPLLALLRAAGPFSIDDLGETDAKFGPVAWVGKMAGRPFDAFALVVQTSSALGARAFGRRLNGERENLRDLVRPLLLFMTADDERALREVAPDFFTWTAQGFDLPPASDLLAYAQRSGAMVATSSALSGTAAATTSATGALTATVVAPLRILHLSDVHFKTGAAKVYDQGRVLDGLLEMLRRDQKDSQIDLICFTGDLANTGAEDEYARAVAFLRDLLSATGVAPDHLFVVPGNHDVDRKIGRWTLRTLRSDEEATEFFLEPESRRLHEQKFEAYRRALAGLLGEARPLGLCTGADAVEVVEIRGAKIAVASFNSAWFAVGDDDIEKLWLGAASVDGAARRVGMEEGVAAAIALMHHPTDYLSERERSAVENRLERSFDLVLRGHLHKDKARSVSTGRGGYVELASPAAYQGSQWPNGCFIGEIDLTHRALRVLPFRFGAATDPWTPDASVFPDDRDGSHLFTLRARASGGAAATALGDFVVKVKDSVVDALAIGASGIDLSDLAALDLEADDLFRELESRGGRVSPGDMKVLTARLATTIPPAPEYFIPWGRNAFEALLTRFVTYWSDHREQWVRVLGDHHATYQLVASAFFQRQAGQPVVAEARFDGAVADLLIGGDTGERAVIELKGGEQFSHGLVQLERVMTAARAGLGAAISFGSNRPLREQGVKRIATGDGRATWVVSL